MAPDRTMTETDIARTLNEWMRRYIAEPEKFTREFQTVTAFLVSTSKGEVPDYGERCAAYQFYLLDEIHARS